MGMFGGFKGKKEALEAVLDGISDNKNSVSATADNFSASKVEEKQTENVVSNMSNITINTPNVSNNLKVSGNTEQSNNGERDVSSQQRSDHNVEDNIFIDIEEQIVKQSNNDSADGKIEAVEVTSPVIKEDNLYQSKPVVDSGTINRDETAKKTEIPTRPVDTSMKTPVTPTMTIETPAQNIESVSSVSEVKDLPYDVIKLGEINGVRFSDVYITPDKKTYIWGGKTNAGLVNVEFKDIAEFLQAIEGAYAGSRSYLLKYKGRNYRVERTIAMGGVQFCARKMPIEVPALDTLGLPEGVYKHLMSLAGESGLILLAGATGSGKSTTIAALMKEYLSLKGGYAFTIEDPVELPLDGVYVTPNGELGLCKQTEPPDGLWEEGIKSALRSKPRYIYLGEIRSPDIASEALRAATSGHLVLSSIHANNVSEAINSLVKYAASSGISEAMAYELVAGGLLGVVHQILSGAPKKAHVTTIFANPDTSSGCQVRGMIRNGKLNLSTLIEQQKILLRDRKPLFRNI